MGEDGPLVGRRAEDRRGDEGASRGRARGSTWLMTAVCATGPERSASSSSAGSVSGGSGAAWCRTVTGWKDGTRRPGRSSAAARASVASRTARQGSSPWSAVVTEVVDTSVTRTPVRTVPGGSAAARSSGTTSAPPSGRHSRPRAYECRARSAHRLDVVRSGSHRSAESSGRRKPSMVRDGRPRAKRASAAGSSGRARMRSTGVAASLASAAARRAWSRALPSGAARGAVLAARGTRGALARARAAVSAPLAPRALVGSTARWCRPSLCTRMPGAKGRSTRAPSSRRVTQFGIRRGEQLTDPVEPEPVDLLRGHSPADVRGGLQDNGRYTGAGQLVGGRQSRDPRSHDDDIRLVRRL